MNRRLQTAATGVAVHEAADFMRAKQRLDPCTHLRMAGAGHLEESIALGSWQRSRGGEDVFLVAHGRAEGLQAGLPLFHARSRDIRIMNPAIPSTATTEQPQAA